MSIATSDIPADLILDAAPPAAEPIAQPARSLKRLAITGAAWTMFGYAISLFLKFGSTLICARLLDPAAFGVMALVNVFLTGLHMFSDVGIGPAIIQHARGTDRHFLHTAWTLQIIRGFSLWMISIAVAWPLAMLYHDRQLAPLMIMAGFTACAAGFNSTKMFTANRDLKMGGITLVNMIASIVGTVLMVLWAWWDRSVWSLVIAGVAASLVTVALSHWMLPGPGDRVLWDWPTAKTLMSFGRWIFASTATWFLASQGERLLLGKFFTMAELGVFSLALLIASTCFDLPRQVVSMVFFPVLAKLVREHRPRAEAQYKKILAILAPVNLLMVLGMIGLAAWMTHIAFDHRYAAMSWILPILAVRAALDLSQGLMSEMLKADGRLQYAVWSNVARIIGIGAGIPIGFYFGGVCGAVIGLCLGAFPGQLIFVVGLFRSFRKLAWLEMANWALLISISVAALWVRLALWK